MWGKGGKLTVTKSGLEVQSQQSTRVGPGTLTLTETILSLDSGAGQRLDGSSQQKGVKTKGVAGASLHASEELGKGP